MKFFKCLNCGSDAVDEVVYKDKIAFQCYACNIINFQASSLDSRLKVSLDSKNQIYHFLASLVIRNENGEVLLIHRRLFPLVWSLVQGHIHNGESEKDAARRELLEEAGINYPHPKFLFKIMVDGQCPTGITRHMISAFEVKVPKDTFLVPNSESDQMIWVQPTELATDAYQPMSLNAAAVLRKAGLLKK